MSIVRTIVKRELGAYFNSPVAYVFLVIFLLLTGFLTFTAGNFFERGEASLAPFFGWHPWLYLMVVPAIGMRLWAEERRSGTLELLFTPREQGWVGTARLAYQGNRFRMQARLRWFGGAEGSAYGAVPTAGSLLLGLEWSLR